MGTYLIHNFSYLYSSSYMSLIRQIYWRGKSAFVVALLLLERWGKISRLYNHSFYNPSLRLLSSIHFIFYGKALKHMRYFVKIYKKYTSYKISIRWILWSQTLSTNAQIWLNKSNLLFSTLFINEPRNKEEANIGRSLLSDSRLLFFFMNGSWWDCYGTTFTMRSMGRSILLSFRLWDCVNTFFLPLNQ